MNEHEKALPAGGPAKPTQNAAKIYVISSRERLLLPLAFCFCLLLVNTLLWSGPTAGLTASVCVWYGLLGLYLGRPLLNTWESRVLLAVNLALAATLALGSNWYFRAWNLLALLALLPVHAIGLSGGQFLPWWRPSMLWERLCLLLWGLFGHLGAALATAWPQKKDGAARRVLPLLLGAAGALALLAYYYEDDVMLRLNEQMYALPPVRRLAAKLQESNPAYQVFAQQMEHCITRSAYPYWPRITGVLSESLYGVMTGGLSPQEAADAIGSKVRLCIGKNDSG